MIYPRTSKKYKLNLEQFPGEGALTANKSGQIALILYDNIERFKDLMNRLVTSYGYSIIDLKLTPSFTTLDLPDSNLISIELSDWNSFYSPYKSPGQAYDAPDLADLARMLCRIRQYQKNLAIHGLLSEWTEKWEGNIYPMVIHEYLSHVVILRDEPLNTNSPL